MTCAGASPTKPKPKAGCFRFAWPKSGADVDPFTVEERESVIAGCRQYYPHYANYVVCAFWTGWHPNEAVALKWARVDFRNGKILIREGRVLGHKSPVVTLEKYNRYVPNLTRADGQALAAVGTRAKRWGVL